MGIEAELQFPNLFIMKQIILFLSVILIMSCKSAPQKDKTSNTGEDTLSIVMEKYFLEEPPLIGSFEGLELFEGGISGMVYIPGTDLEFYLINDRGPNMDMRNHENAKGQNVKLFPFPEYTQKIFHVKVIDNQLQILDILEIKRPDGGTITGLPYPGSMDYNREVAWKNLNGESAGIDNWGFDLEGIAIGRNNDFWAVDEYRTSILNIDRETAKIKSVFTPGNMYDNHISIDSIYKYRRPNRGFESVTITPSGKVYAMLQSPLWNPDRLITNTSRLVRLFELDPNTGESRTFLYEMEDKKGDVEIKDRKVGDMVAVNDSMFLILEHGTGQQSSFMDIYRININNATVITDNQYMGLTPEQLNDANTALKHNIHVVKKTHYLDLIAAGYSSEHEKPEGIAIIDENTIAVINDNDYGVDAPNSDSNIISTGVKTCLYIFRFRNNTDLDL